MNPFLTRMRRRWRDGTISLTQQIKNTLGNPL
jgi:hypothetical protein